jgi:phosphatidylglycerol:prolipoprotein diacylglycerol transferase
MNIDPIAFNLGPFSVRWYGLLIATALLLGTYLASREVERQGIDLDQFLNILLVSVPFAIFGARLYYVVLRWDYYSQQPLQSLKIWEGGLSIHGAVITGLLVGYQMTRHYSLSFLQLADIVSPSLILGQAIGRWGNFFNQEAFGYPTDLPWAMYIAGEYRHPTFLYESIWNILIFAILLHLRSKDKLQTGDIFLTYLAGYSIGRFFIEGFRTDSLMFGSYRAAQLVSIATVICVLLYRFYWIRRKKGNESA